MLFASCHWFKKEPKELSYNIFRDQNIQKIYTLSILKNDAELLKYLYDENDVYKAQAILGFSSIGDSANAKYICPFVGSDNQEIKNVSIFTLGTIGGQISQKTLREALEKEINPDFKRKIIAALSRCGDVNALNQICAVQCSDTYTVESVSMALANFALRGFANNASTTRAIEILQNSEYSEKSQIFSSQYFKYAKIDFSDYYLNLMNVYKNTQNVDVKQFLIEGLAFSLDQRINNFLRSQISDTSLDENIRISAIKSLAYQKEDNFDFICSLIDDENEQVSKEIANYLYEFSDKSKLNCILTYSKTTKKWQTRTILLKTALKLSDEKDKISANLISGYNVSQNIDEKIMLLDALSEDASKYREVEKEIFYNDEPRINICGLVTLAKMRKSQYFEVLKEKMLKEKGENLLDEFAILFKKAVQDGNMELKAFAAKCIADSTFGFEYKNTHFLEQALKQCNLPYNEDAYGMLAIAIHHTDGRMINPPDIYDIENFPDWEKICAIDGEQKIKFTTNKGSFVVQLKVNQSPIAVCNFVEMVQKKSLNNSNFFNLRNKTQNAGYKTEFNEGYDIIYPKEISPDNLLPGALCWNSSLFDNASLASWFIIKQPLIEFQNNYTNFANIVKGNDIANSLETGDKIIEVEIQKE